MGGSAKGQTFTHFEKYLPNTQVPELLIYDETQYVVDRLDEVVIRGIISIKRAKV